MGAAGLRSALSHTAGAYIASMSAAAELDGWDMNSAVGWKDAVQEFLIESGRPFSH